MSVIDSMADTIAIEQVIPKTQAREIVRMVFDLVGEELCDEGECAIPQFGKFIVTEREAGEGRNPRTGAKIQIAASKQAKWKPSQTLKDRLNPEPRKGATVSAQRAGPPAQRRASA